MFRYLVEFERHGLPTSATHTSTLRFGTNAGLRWLAGTVTR
jgi:hypothetical protein